MTCRHTAAWTAGSRTTPCLPTSPRPASNCGLTSATTVPSGARQGSSGGRISLSEMNDTSMDANAAGCANQPGSIYRAFVRSMTVTRASPRSFQSS